MTGRDWVQRIGAISGLHHETAANINVRGLPGYGLTPSVRKYSFEGAARADLEWRWPDGSTTGYSPSSAWVNVEGEFTAAEKVLRLDESLELPGTPSEYHFALLRTYEFLWPSRRRQCEILSDIERLCLLDIQLVETVPSIINSDGVIFSVPAFIHLIQLYELDGYLEDAFHLARRAAAIGQNEDNVNRLEKRTSESRSEDDA